MVGPAEAVRLGYLDHAVAADEIDAAVAGELERLKRLDWKSHEGTKVRLNELISTAIASAAAEYQPSTWKQRCLTRALCQPERREGPLGLLERSLAALRMTARMAA